MSILISEISQIMFKRDIISIWKDNRKDEYKRIEIFNMIF